MTSMCLLEEARSFLEEKGMKGKRMKNTKHTARTFWKRGSFQEIFPPGRGEFFPLFVHHIEKRRNKRERERERTFRGILLVRFRRDNIVENIVQNGTIYSCASSKYRETISIILARETLLKLLQPGVEISNLLLVA